MIAVLDTSAILSGKFCIGKDISKVVTSPSVIDEFSEGGHSYRLMQYAREAGMKVLAPPEDAMEKVREAARLTGDIGLSKADIEVLALAFYLKDDAILFTDDYSIQNVAEHIGVKYKGMLQEGIKKKFYWKWKYKCMGCGRFVESEMDICPVCGGKIKRVRWK
ncbi:MAG: NOB1 family endonuclease [Candidatus Thermoplasmatota archaeon]|nr:NOB1 family endonuclease [Candidatus Thermoplasmatota archaeon]